MSALRRFQTRITPQSEPLIGQVENSAGGYSYQIGPLQQLRRFLILGTEGGTAYINESELTADNAQSVLSLLHSGQERAVIDMIVEVSNGGLAPKNDQALFALALACSQGSVESRRRAFEVLPLVARTSTHLFQFVGFLEQFRGWGRQARTGVAAWYASRSDRELAYQFTKYGSREGWTHLDVLRLCHDTSHPALYEWLRSGLPVIGPEFESLDTHAYLVACEEAKHITVDHQAIDLIRDYRLTWEQLNTELLRSPLVWETLSKQMPLGALVRNLGRMTANGTLSMGKVENVLEVCGRLRSTAAIQGSRLHPMNLLLALRTYASGQGHRGRLSWVPVPQILDALDEAYVLAFQNVEPTGKRYLLGLDVSGSMSYPEIATNLTPREGAAALAHMLVQTEDHVQAMAFSTYFIPLSFSKRQRLDDMINSISYLPFGGTDCALPMLYALEQGLEIDTFVVLTDSETWYGDVHPVQALQQYRERTGIQARLIVVAMEANDYSIADPNDPGMIDFVGFDASLPRLISAFSKGDI